MKNLLLIIIGMIVAFVFILILEVIRYDRYVVIEIPRIEKKVPQKPLFEATGHGKNNTCTSCKEDEDKTYYSKQKKNL